MIYLFNIKISNENSKYSYFEQLDEKNHYTFENCFSKNEVEFIKDKMNKSDNFI